MQSAPLQLLAMKMASDPFAKVKNLVQQLIERLISESNDEATHKGWCDTELSTKKHDRDHRHDEIEKLSASVTALEANKRKLNEEKSDLTSEVTDLNSGLSERTKNRAEEKTNNQNTIEEAQLGLGALKK